MFKSLRDRLKQVSSQLEDELEARLEDELEKELEAQLAGDAGRGSQEPAPESTPEPTPAEPTPVLEPTPAPPTQAREPAKEEPADEPSTEAKQPATDGEHADQQRAAVAAPVAAASPQEEPASEQEEASAAPTAPTASAPVAPAQEAPKPSQPITGRKMISAEEVEARLQRELQDAVEVQKEVESVVQAEGRARYTINEDVLEDILWELEVGLLESDVALPVIEAIKESVKEQLLAMTVGGSSPEDVVEKVLRSAIRRVLSVNPIDFDAFVRKRLDEGKRPVVVMFVGVNGTGKTTSIARLAHRLKGQGLGVVMAAGDTFRAGAIEQLSLHGERLGVKVVKHSAGADPAAVAFDAVEHAKARHKDVVLLDTAGRMQTNTNLMAEMDKIRRVADPDMVVFVGDSLAGNDAVEQARRFDEVVDIDGVVLTKVDVDAKGGAALSVAYTINKPLMFVGVGQDYPDLRPFDATWMVDRIFGDEVVA